MKKIFETKIYYSGFYVSVVEAENQDEAILIARKSKLDKNEFLSTLQNWEEADTAIEIKNEKIN